MRSLFFVLFCFFLNSIIAQDAAISLFGEPEPIRAVNSQYDESFLALHPSGERMIITRRIHPGNIGGKHNPGDLWITSLDSAWHSPKPSINVHPSKMVSPIGFVNSGRYLLYSTTMFDVGVFRGEIWVAELDGDTLVNHRRMDITNFNNLSEHQSASISADGKHILFSMEGNFTYGVEDLYVSHLNSDGKWSSPRNLGYRINTAFQEYTPFLAPDNETLIFATNGRPDTNGSFDLYVSRRIDDTWQNWTEPVNLGSVNTRGSETSFSFLPGSDYAYYVSTTDSDGYGDVKRIRITSDIQLVEQSQTDFQLEAEVDPTAKVFTLVDEDNNKVEGTILLLGENTNEELQSGENLSFENYEDLVIETRAQGYLNHMTNITGSELQNTDSIFISVDELKVGNTINLEHVLFYQGTANFIEGSETELNVVSEMLKENPKVKILLKGHTDNRGDPALNLELSRERVKVVQEYLLSTGIDYDRIQGRGYGGNDPIAPNDTEENRRLNRRVEFTIISN